jgi:hypothetical protein
MAKPKANKPANPVGRPSAYTEEIGMLICSLIAEGKSLVSITKREDMPSTVTVYTWLKNDEKFLNMYTRAREDQADTLADEIIAIADDSHNDDMITKGGDVVANTEFIARSKLRVEARKWVAAKLKPKKYGDKLDLNADLNHKGEIQHNHAIINLTGVTKNEPAEPVSSK